MTNILRKKIEQSTGIPPSIQNAEAFWSEVSASVSAWVFKGLEEVIEASISQRKMVTGEEIANSADEESLAFYIPPVAGHGLAGIRLKRDLAVKFAARRMHQPIESMAGTSDLFLTLISEDPAMLLRESISAHVAGRAQDFERGIEVDLGFNSGELSPTARYIEAAVECPLEEGGGQLHLLFEFSALKTFWAKRLAGGRGASGSSKLSEHGLIGSSVKKSDVCVDGVLERLRMSVGACSRLKVGQVLPLLTADREAIIVSVDTVSGSSKVSQGRLGIWKKKRAIKLTAPVSADFVRDLVGF